MLASVTELGLRLGRTLAEGSPEYLRAQADLEDVSTFAMSIAGCEWDAFDEVDGDNPAPADVVAVVLGAAKRKFQNPEGYRSQSAGDFSVELDSYSTNMFSSFELDILRKYKPGNGFGVVSFTRGEGAANVNVRYRAEYPGGFYGTDIVMGE